jgi:hypothetical protein
MYLSGGDFLHIKLLNKSQKNAIKSFNFIAQIVLLIRWRQIIPLLCSISKIQETKRKYKILSIGRPR